MVEKIIVEGRSEDAARIHAAISDAGFALISLPDYARTDRNMALETMDTCLRMLAEPIQLYEQYRQWRPIGIGTQGTPSKSEGARESPLHVDFVNAANPPDLVVLYCERPDPAGGGATTLAPISTAYSLPAEVMAELGEPCYVAGPLFGLKNIGADISPFAVLSPADLWVLRYTGALLMTSVAKPARDALRALDAALRSEMVTIILEAGDAVVINQHLTVHGRLPFGPGHRAIPVADQRLLWQRFGRRPEYRL